MHIIDNNKYMQTVEISYWFFGCFYWFFKVLKKPVVLWSDKKPLVYWSAGFLHLAPDFSKTENIIEKLINEAFPTLFQTFNISLVKM